MGNMTELYGVVRRFCDLRQDERRKYLARKTELESTKGSRYYTEQMEAAKEQRQTALDTARRDAESAANVILARMMDKAGEIELEPLTAAQMSVIQYLQMRKSLTQDEVMMASNALRTSGLGLELLKELARDRGVKYPLVSTRDVKTSLTIDGAKHEVSNLGHFCASVFADVAGANTIRRMMAERHARIYGGGVDIDPDELPEEATFTSERDFYDKALGVTYEAFARFAD